MVVLMDNLFIQDLNQLLLLVKRTDTLGDWDMYDSAKEILLILHILKHYLANTISAGSEATV
jgi:hypothetical protein